MTPVGVQVENKWYNGLFKGDDLNVVANWSPGEEIEILTYKKGDYDNFRLPSRLDKLEGVVKSHHKIIKDLLARVKAVENKE